MSCNQPLWHKIIFRGCPIKLTLQNKGGVGGWLGYFVWEELVFQA